MIHVIVYTTQKPLACSLTTQVVGMSLPPTTHSRTDVAGNRKTRLPAKESYQTKIV